MGTETFDPDDMEPPSKNSDNCGNCWMELGTTEWCPTCTIEREFRDTDKQLDTET